MEGGRDDGDEEGDGAERVGEGGGSATLGVAEGARGVEVGRCAEGGAGFVGSAYADTGSPGSARSLVGLSDADERSPIAKTVAAVRAAAAPAPASIA